MNTLMWFRSDLRLYDNTALFHATRHSKAQCIAIYLITPYDWKKKHWGALKIDFILRNVLHLSQALAKKNIPLLLPEIKKSQDLVPTLFGMIKDYRVAALYFNRRYEWSDQQLEKKIIQSCQKNSIEVYACDDETILSPGSVKTGADRFYQIFTPFKKRWIQTFKDSSVVLHASPRKQSTVQNVLKVESQLDIYAVPSVDSTVIQLWPAGESAALNRLKKFMKQSIFSYHTERDYPALDATSRLSPYLAAGVISARTCLIKALAVNHHELHRGEKGVLAWINELIWRDFYKHLLFGFPRLSRGEAFKEYLDQIPWQRNQKLLHQWEAGQTGYPLIDASIRQLRQTGWMHNRLRMVVSSFLIKLLRIDWRFGEKFFAEHLIDYDFSANNGGWQWSASTGADSVPYFRIFNPWLQSKRYDPDGQFIRQFCPEIQHLNVAAIHKPKKEVYFEPIVNYQSAREETLQLYKTYVKRKKS